MDEQAARLEALRLIPLSLWETVDPDAWVTDWLTDADRIAVYLMTGRITPKVVAPMDTGIRVNLVRSTAPEPPPGGWAA